MIKKTTRFISKTVTGLLIISLSLAVAWSLNLGASHLPIRRYFNNKHHNAIWDWSNISKKTSRDIEKTADYLYMHQINSVYVDIGLYASILNIDDKKERIEDKLLLEESIEQYVKGMQRRQIKVYASAGDVDWSNHDKQYIPLEILSFVQSYNIRHPDAKLRGVMFDIESYNQDGFNEGSDTVKSLVLTDYIHLVDRLAGQAKSYNNQNGEKLELGFAIPYWFDNQNGNIPLISWQGKSGPTLYHILDRLNELDSSKIIVMAYRNAARGNDGVINHVRTEIDYAEAKTQNVDVIVGQEVGDVEPEKVTYYDRSKAELSAQFSFVNEEYKDNENFGGIAINDLTSFKELRSGD